MDLSRQDEEHETFEMVVVGHRRGEPHRVDVGMLRLDDAGLPHGLCVRSSPSAPGPSSRGGRGASAQPGTRLGQRLLRLERFHLELGRGTVGRAAAEGICLVSAQDGQ